MVGLLVVLFLPLLVSFVAMNGRCSVKLHHAEIWCTLAQIHC